ncbi:hypothetical protein Bbelb_354570 [Branchiostoma belcheri]|nr:hypothetical protein Bbelb_386350 [Branchiostoma belcheri]KAI8486709.1 hypothetical protein Bbelb_354570 [Branchiostoma belcheri]
MSTLETPVGNRVLEEEEITEAAEPHQGSKAKRLFAAASRSLPVTNFIVDTCQNGPDTLQAHTGGVLREGDADHKEYPGEGAAGGSSAAYRPYKEDCQGFTLVVTRNQL